MPCGIYQPVDSPFQFLLDDEFGGFCLKGTDLPQCAQRCEFLSGLPRHLRIYRLLEALDCLPTPPQFLEKLTFGLPCLVECGVYLQELVVILECVLDPFGIFLKFLLKWNYGHAFLRLQDVQNLKLVLFFSHGFDQLSLVEYLQSIIKHAQLDEDVCLLFQCLDISRVNFEQIIATSKFISQVFDLGFLDPLPTFHEGLSNTPSPLEFGFGLGFVGWLRFLRGFP